MVVEESDAPALSVVLKWGKKRFALPIMPGRNSGRALKEQAARLTGVPVERQKIMCRGAWKGVLKDDASVQLKPRSILSLVGTAGELPTSKVPSIKFAEDVTPEEIVDLEARQDAEAMEHAEGNIPALQFRPGGGQRDDGKAIRYRYNYFVTGLPQRYIESLLRKRRRSGSGLLGECAMTLGTELGKAFVTAVVALQNGVLVSGHDDGKLQLWREGRRLCEVYHKHVLMDKPGPITALAVAVGTDEVAFASAGSGTIKLWDIMGDCLQTVSSPRGTVPHKLLALDAYSFAAAFCQERPFDPHQFRLVPENEAQAQRRAAAIEAQQQERIRFGQIACSISIVEWTAGGEFRGSTVLEPWESRAGGEAPMVTTLTIVGGKYLWIGDVEGGLRAWQSHLDGRWHRSALLQFINDDIECGCSVTAMETLHHLHHPNLVAVATSLFSRRDSPLPPGRYIDPNDAIMLPVSLSQLCVGSVVLVDVVQHSAQMVLANHQDSVCVLRSLPNGNLLTGGGKKDATLKVWDRKLFDGEKVGVDQAAYPAAQEEDDDALLQQALELSLQTDAAGDRSNPVVITEARVLKEPGYIFDACVLMDSKPGSSLFAIAGARYNVVKICL